MPIDFYQLPGSSPCRAVALTAAALGVEMNFKQLNLMTGEHLKPEFLKMNPQHTIPTINDNGFCLWESRAIMAYLADQYGKNDSLYPKDAKKRAVVNQRLYFDMGTLYQAFSEYYYPMVFAGAAPDKAKYEKIAAALTLVEKFLEGENYLAGKTLTLADLSIVPTIANLEIMDYDLSSYKNIVRWYSKMKTEIPKYQEYDAAGAKAFKVFFESAKKK